MAQKKQIVLVDGSSYLFRAYYALPALSNSKGQPTGAIYGVINMLRRLLTDHTPDGIAVVFDPKGGSFRNTLYPAYKANRTIMPDDLQQQIQPLFRTIRALGFPLIIKEGVEADDVIATLALKAKQQGMRVLISTGDKDLAQIVDDHITLINTMTDQQLDAKGVEQKFGVPPEKIIDYLALVGDTSDNVPGIPQVGPKTAVRWLTQYGSLDNIIQHADEIPGKVGDNLRQHLQDLPLMRQLVTLLSTVNVEEDPRCLLLAPQDLPTLIQLFTELEFQTWLAELRKQKEMNVSLTTYTTILDKKTFKQWQNQLIKSAEFSLDTETTSLDPQHAQLVGISVAVHPGKAAYIPLAHDYSGAPQQLDREWVLQQLKPLLDDPARVVIGQNMKYDRQILSQYGVNIRARSWDTLLESYVLNSVGTRRDLNSLSLKYLGKGTILFTDVAGKGDEQLTFNQIPLDKATAYAAEDADIALQLHRHFFPLLKQHSSLLSVLEKIEMPLVTVLARMEMRGVLIDPALLQQQSQDLQARIQELEQEAWRLAKKTFNLNSPKQLQTIFYDELQLPILKKTPGGQPSTSEFVLQTLALDYPLPKVILEHRGLSKLKSTYTDRLPEQMDSLTHRVHTSYNQAVTATGRLSSNNPNLQNIPIRTEEGKKVRRAFVAPPGYRLVAADYSQIELRIMAHISKDPNLIQAFENRLDIHRATAAEVFGVPLTSVTPDQRRRAKAINFGLLYGMSSFGLAQQLGITQELAKKYMDTYFARYPNVYDYMQSIREQAAKQGYVETLFGRRLYVPDIHSTNSMHRRAGERAAINAPMQGSAADIIKLAMIAVDDWLVHHAKEAHMIMQVHDELVFEVPQADVERVSQHIRHLMEKAAELIVPLVVDIGEGENWEMAH